VLEKRPAITRLIIIMYKIKLRLSFFIITVAVFASCKNYYIPKDSFIKQFHGMDSTRLRNVKVRGPYGSVYNYAANSINTIRCVDKKGNSAELSNSPSIETRITLNNKKRVIFYFDRVIMQDSIVYGIQSRFLTNIRKAIPVKDITKIEVQDGHKNFVYIEVE